MGESTAIFGPPAPAVGMLIILSEAFAAVANLIRVIGNAINLVLLISGGKPIEPGVFEVADGFAKPKEICDGIKDKCESLQKEFESLKAGLHGIMSTGKKLDERRRGSH